MPPTATTPSLSDPVVRFCADHHLLAVVEDAIRIAEEAFAPVTRLRVDLDTDGETGDKFLVLDLVVSADASRARESKKAFTRRWIDAACPDARAKVRLVYHIA